MLTPSLEDRALIEELFARYAWTLDVADTDGFVDCFTPDAVFDDVVRAVGHDQIRRLMRRKYHENPTFAGRQHWVGQFIFDPDESAPDRCRVRSFAAVSVRRDVGVSLFWTGYYDDIVQKVDGRWVFAVKQAYRWEGDVLAAFPANSIALQRSPANMNDPID